MARSAISLAHPERMKKTVAAMTVDTPAASYDLAGTEYTFYMNPQVAMSYTDALIQRIAKDVLHVAAVALERERTRNRFLSWAIRPSACRMSGPIAASESKHTTTAKTNPIPSTRVRCTI